MAVVLLATGAVPPAVAGLIGAVGMVVTGVLTSQHAYRAVSWQTVVLIGGLIPMSVAISSSGAADLVAEHLVDLVGGGSPRLLLAALFVLTLALGGWCRTGSFARRGEIGQNRHRQNGR